MLKFTINICKFAINKPINNSLNYMRYIFCKFIASDCDKCDLRGFLYIKVQ